MESPTKKTEGRRVGDATRLCPFCREKCSIRTRNCRRCEADITPVPELYKLINDMKDLMEKMGRLYGVQGGCFLYHPTRSKDGGTRMFRNFLGTPGAGIAFFERFSQIVGSPRSFVYFLDRFLDIYNSTGGGDETARGRIWQNEIDRSSTVITFLKNPPFCMCVECLFPPNICTNRHADPGSIIPGPYPGAFEIVATGVQLSTVDEFVNYLNKNQSLGTSPILFRHPCIQHLLGANQMMIEPETSDPHTILKMIQKKLVQLQGNWIKDIIGWQESHCRKTSHRMVSRSSMVVGNDIDPEQSPVPLNHLDGLDSCKDEDISSMHHPNPYSQHQTNFSNQSPVAHQPIMQQRTPMHHVMHSQIGQHSHGLTTPTPPNSSSTFQHHHSQPSSYLDPHSGVMQGLNSHYSLQGMHDNQGGIGLSQQLLQSGIDFSHPNPNNNLDDDHHTYQQPLKRPRMGLPEDMKDNL